MKGSRPVNASAKLKGGSGPFARLSYSGLPQRRFTLRVSRMILGLMATDHVFSGPVSIDTPSCAVEDGDLGETFLHVVTGAATTRRLSDEEGIRQLETALDSARREGYLPSFA